MRMSPSPGGNDEGRGRVWRSEMHTIVSAGLEAVERVCGDMSTSFEEVVMVLRSVF